MRRALAGGAGARALPALVAAGAALGGVLLTARVALLGPSPAMVVPAVAVAAGLAALAWRAAGTLPLLPWLAGWPIVALSATNPLARQHLTQSGSVVCLYLAGWLLTGAAAVRLWRAALPTGSHSVHRAPSLAFLGSRSISPATLAIAVPLLAFAAVTYWNGAVLDALQFRGVPDYVTQMRGARRMLAGALPYDPTIRVWTDVNLPPITLLLIFVPFTGLPELAGRLAYLLLNHVAYLGGLALLLRAAFLRSRPATSFLTLSLVAALALMFEPWHDSQRLGQQNGIVLFFLAVTAVASAMRRDTLAGAALAAALIGKPSSALLGLYFLLAGRWRAVFSAGLTGLAVFLVTLPWAGVENWRFYLLEKAPDILAGTPQQSNVALLAYHARLFLPLEALASFDAMPDVPLALALTRVSQVLGAVALWRLVRRRSRQNNPLNRYLEVCFTLALSLCLVGHAWQSYVSWLIIAFAPLALPELWQGLARPARWVAAALAGLCYAALGVNDVTLHRVVGSTSVAAAVFAALPAFALLTLAFLLALLLVGYERGAQADQNTGSPLAQLLLRSRAA